MKSRVVLSAVASSTKRRFFLSVQIMPSRVLLEKRTGPQLVKKFLSFYGTRRFITAFTRCRHLFLSWATSLQFMPVHPTARRSVKKKLSSHLLLGLRSGFFPSGFHTKTLYAHLLPHVCVTCPAHLILLDLITWIIFGGEYTSWDHEAPHCVFFCTPMLPRPEYLPQHPFLHHFQFMFFP
jgi:hypothetical protein